MSTFFLILKSFFNQEALRTLYRQRQALLPAEKNRTIINLSTTAALFTFTLMFLLSMAWFREDVESYTAQQTFLSPHPELLDGWQASTPIVKQNCLGGKDCYGNLLRQSHGLHETSLATFIFKPAFNASLNQKSLLLLRRTIPTELWQHLKAFSNHIVLTLPSFSYDRLDVMIDGQIAEVFFANEQVAINIDPQLYTAQEVELELLFEVGFLAGPFLNIQQPRLDPIQRSANIMTLAEYRGYRNFVVTNQAGRGNFIGAIARIVMAVFVLALFMIIDSSPETLGLSLFMGFEGFAISLSYGWLPLENIEFVRHFCYQMGDIMRLFFFLQMARLISKRLSPWLVWGTLLSIPYGLIRYYEVALNIPALSYIPASRDLLVGSIGTLVCLRSAWYLKSKGVPWRVVALLLASAAACEQTLDPLSEFFTGLNNISGVRATIDALQPLSAWLLAFSAFINISTLENRVRLLSGVASRAREIEHEMELAKTVQNAFLYLPKMPDEVSIETHHEAMLYVSGDTYYAHWNEKDKKVTFLINDVTGHGVQAALKASGVSVIANTLWNASDEQPWKPHKLSIYANEVERFYRNMNENPDIVCLGGAEFDIESGTVYLYRRNFPYPILIAPKLPDREYPESRKSDNWIVRMLTIPNNSETSLPLTEGSFIVFTSDGFLDNSRKAYAFIRHLRKHIGGAAPDLTPQAIKQLILDNKSFEHQNIRDDRTLLVFQWRNKQASQIKPVKFENHSAA